MTLGRTAAVVACVALGSGTFLDRPDARPRVPGAGVLAADLHVHGGLPLDSTIPPWEAKREARRRGLDVIAIVGHNQAAVASFERVLPDDDVIVLTGAEIGNAGLHLIAAGVSETVDWRLAADEAIETVQRRGGVAIAAHPVDRSWVTRNERALQILDGAEVAHPLSGFVADAEREMKAFYDRARAGNPRLAPIGSSDFHNMPDLGVCRTYLLVNERSERGVLEAIRAGRTVASNAQGTLTGDPEFVERVRAHVAANPEPPRSRLQSALAFAALAALATMIVIK